MTDLNRNHHHVVLKKLFIENKISKFAEIGVYKCRLMRTLLRDPVASSIKEYWAIDQWKVDSNQWVGRSQKDWDALYMHACKYLPWFSQLKIMRLPSVEAAKLFWPGFFDMVYLDANHTYEYVLDDIKAWLPLVRKGGILAGHDYAHGDTKATLQVKKAVNKFFGDGNFVVDDCTVWWKKI